MTHVAALPNLDVAKAFIEALTGRPDTPVSWQTFHDSKDASKDEKSAVTGIMHGSVEEHWAKLVSLNNAGAGIFVTVNQTDLKGRSASNIVSLRALFVDSDTGPIDVADLALTPHIVTDSVNGNHLYWLLKDGEPLAAFTPAQKRLIATLKTDTCVHDLPRVLRVPGFLHRKKNPTMVTFRVLSTEQKYSVDEVVQAVAGDPVDEQDAAQRTGQWAPVADQATAVACCRSYLAQMSPAVEGSGGDDQTFKVACIATRDFGLTQENALTAMREWNDNCVPPWSENALLEKIEHAVAYAKGVAGSKLEQGWEPWTDSGNAERLVRLHGADIRYCDNRGWFSWDGRRFREDGEALVQQRAKQTAREMARSAASMDERIGAALKAHAKNSESRERRNAMVQLARYEPSVLIRAEELDRDPLLLNVANAVIDLRVGQAVAQTRDLLLTKLARVAFDASATCPTWRAFLDRIMAGNQPLIEFLQRAVGYSLTAEVSEQVLFFAYGGGANGKTTFVNTLSKLLGEYARPAAPNLLLVRQHEAHPTELADLLGARVVIAQEVPQNCAMSESLVKQPTGGDRLKARLMRGDFFEFEPTHKIWLCANHKPEVRGIDHAIWRRILLLPFTVTIPEAEKDKDFGQKLAAELPGILNWAIEGCLSWQKNGLRPPNEVKAATSEYREEMDLVGDFIRECCELEPRARTMSHDLNMAFSKWCFARGEPPRSPKFLGAGLSTRPGLHSQKGNRCNSWVGIRLASESTKQPGVGDADDKRPFSNVSSVKVIKNTKPEKSENPPHAPSSPDFWSSLPPWMNK